MIVGVSFIAWSVTGLYLSDHIEEKFGLTPTEEDKAELSKLGPRIIAVDRKEESS